MQTKIKSLWLSIIVVSAAIYLSGCGGGTSGSSTTGNTSTPTTSVTITAAPPSTMAPSATASITATVANDSSNAGVDWSCTPSGTCGSFNPAHTASGAATTFTAGSTAGTVTITAKSTSTASASQTATVTISGGTTGSTSALPAGQYSFYAGGQDAQLRTYVIAGSITLDGKGNVTGGEQDYNSVGGATSPEPTPDSITGGSLVGKSNNQATLTLVTNDTSVGVKGTETFAVSIANSKHALIAEYDATATSSGSLDLQTLPSGTPTALNGTWSMVVSGKNGSNEEIFGGIVVGDGNGNVHVQIDQNEGGTISRNGSNVGTDTAPDGKGRGTMAVASTHFAYYVVTPKAMRFIVISPTIADVGSAFAGVSGTSNATLNTTFVFSVGSNSGGPFVSAAGLIVPDGNGHVSGYADVDETGQATSAAFQGTYTVASNGYSTITITPGNTQNLSVLALYLTDPSVNLEDPNNPNGGACGLLIDLDSKINGSGLLILPQTVTAAPSGNFAWGIQEFSSNNESDGVGYVSINGTALTGTEALNDLSATGQNPAITLSGTIAADTKNPRRYTIPLTVNLGKTPAATNYVLYQVSSTEVIVIDTGTQFGLGVMEQQQ